MIPAPPDPPELDEILWSEFPPVEVAFDIGANAGQTIPKILAFAKRVVAFEPWEEAAEYIRQAFSGDARVEVETAAVSNKSTGIELVSIPSKIQTGQLVSLTAPLMEWAEEARDIGERIFFPSTTLDDYVAAHDLPSVGFLKIDVEGHEMLVLLGATRLLESLPHMLIEVHGRDLGVEITKLLRPKYSLETVTHPYYAPDEALRQEHYWVKASPKR